MSTSSEKAASDTLGQTKGDSGGTVVRTVGWGGKDTRRYWESRIRFRAYTDAKGKQRDVRHYQVRLKSGGRDTWFNLGTDNKSEAARKAQKIWNDLQSRGLKATTELHKPKAEHRPEMTVEKFIEHCWSIRAKLDEAEQPRHATFAGYVGSLEQVCTLARVLRIADLTAEKVSEFRDKYREAGRKDAKRSPSSVDNSCNAILREAGSLFAKHYLSNFPKLGVPVTTNPFAGLKVKRVEIQSYEPLRKETVDGIWKESRLLLTGDPSAPAPKRLHTSGSSRRLEPDFRKRQIGANMLLLLEMGLGLRRNEADKCEWTWFREERDAAGEIIEVVLTVKETPFFKPKSGQKRFVPVQVSLYKALLAARDASARDATGKVVELGKATSPFVVPGVEPKPLAKSKTAQNAYRCEPSHRALAFWLRSRFGIQDDKPCHLLRKQFGSYIATAFGLFAAQRLLGHSSPQVTSDYYAALTELPDVNKTPMRGHA